MQKRVSSSLNSNSCIPSATLDSCDTTQYSGEDGHSTKRRFSLQPSVCLIE